MEDNVFFRHLRDRPEWEMSKTSIWEGERENRREGERERKEREEREFFLNKFAGNFK